MADEWNAVLGARESHLMRLLRAPPRRRKPWLWGDRKGLHADDREVRHG